MISIHWNPTPAELRRWAFITAAALGVMGSLFHFVDWGVFRVGHGLAPFMWGFAGFALLTAGTGTRIGLPAYWAWMGFTFAIGTILATVALAIVFYGVITPMAIIARFAGRDRLVLRDPRGASLWRSIAGVTKHDPERQF